MGLAFLFYFLGFILLLASITLFIAKRVHAIEGREEVMMLKKVGLFISKLLSDDNNPQIVGWRRYSSSIALAVAALACFAASLFLQSTV